MTQKVTVCCPSILFHTKTKEVPNVMISYMFVALNGFDISTFNQFYFLKITGYYSVLRFPASPNFTQDAVLNSHSFNATVHRPRSFAFTLHTTPGHL